MVNSAPPSSVRRVSGNPLLPIREGAGLFALAVLFPLAVEGLFVAALWPLTAWGQRPGFEGGTTIAVLLFIVLVLAIRYVLLATYWTWLALAHGQRIRLGLLSALPIVGIVWALVLASRVAGGDGRYRPLATVARALLIAISVFVMLLIPMTMQFATAQHVIGQERLAAPCIVLPLAAGERENVIALGDDGIDQATLESWAAQVAEAQGAAALQDPNLWSLALANRYLQMALVDRTAKRLGITSSVGDVRELGDRFREDIMTTEGNYDAVAALGMPSDWESPYLCARALASAILESYPDDGEDPETGMTPYDMQVLLTAKRQGVEVDPALGFWNPGLLSITVDPPAPSAVDEPETIETTAPAVRYDTRVEYETASIPQGDFPGTREWNADVCIGDAALLQSTYLNRVQLFERSGGAWRRVTDAKATSERGGRCDGSQVNVLIGSEADESPAVWFDQGWRTCTPYQVRVPETPRFRPVTIDLCVTTQAVTEGDYA